MCSVHGDNLRLTCSTMDGGGGGGNGEKMAKNGDGEFGFFTCQIRHFFANF